VKQQMVLVSCTILALPAAGLIAVLLVLFIVVGVLFMAKRNAAVRKKREKNLKNTGAD